MERAIEFAPLFGRTRLPAIVRMMWAPISSQDRLAALVVPEAIQQLTDLPALVPESGRRLSSESLPHPQVLRDGRRI